MSPSMFVVLALAVLFGALGSLLMIIASSTDNWEESSWDSTMLKKVPNVDLNASIFNDENQFYKVVLKLTKDDTVTTKTFYLRSNYGGIWRLCDKTTSEFRESAEYASAAEAMPTMGMHCIYYITEFGSLRDNNYLDPTGEEMGGMQNSAASCVIVSIMCLVTAAIIGGISIWQRQVSACMVTGVMYVVSAVFNCFALIIVITKLSYMSNDCYSIDPGLTESTAICACRTTGVSWSVPVAWLSFAMFLISAIFWCLMSRFLRLEKTKSMI